MLNQLCHSKHLPNVARSAAPPAVSLLRHLRAVLRNALSTSLAFMVLNKRSKANRANKARIATQGLRADYSKTVENEHTFFHCFVFLSRNASRSLREKQNHRHTKASASLRTQPGLSKLHKRYLNL